MLRILLLLISALALSATLASVASANHIIGMPCHSCADHDQWPRLTLDHVQRADKEGTTHLDGTDESDELMGYHTSDTLKAGGGSDILWGDYSPYGQPASQVDHIYGGPGEDFIYGSHGRNVIDAGAGNDAISVHYGRGVVDCGPGRDIYHVAKSRKHKYQFVSCEKVDYRTESQRGGGLRPLSAQRLLGPAF